MEREFNNINKHLAVRLPNKLLTYLEQETPKDTGETSRSWRINKKGSNGFSMENGRGGIVEFLMKGVKPHIINSKDDSVLTVKLPGSILFAKFVNHPGYSPKIVATDLWNGINIIIEKEINEIVTDIVKRKLSI